MKGKPVLAVISGYYGFDNMGDEALLEALLSQWRRLRPNTGFIVLSGNPTATAARHGVEAIGRTDLRAITRSLRRASVFVSGGGSLLQDVSSARTVPYYAAMMTLARLYGVPVVVYSQGIGPITRPFLRRMAGRALQQAAAVTIRDAASAREAVALGVRPEQVIVTADPIFSDVVRTAPFDVSPSLPGALPAGPLLGVSLRPFAGNFSHERTLEFVDWLAAQLLPLLDKYELRMLPLPLYAAQDEEPLRRLAEVLGPERVVPWPVRVDPRQLAVLDWLWLFRRIQLCVTMRLHGLIFSAVAETPFIAVADDPKVDAHVAELGLNPEHCVVAASGIGSRSTIWRDGSGSTDSASPPDVAFTSMFERLWRNRENGAAEWQAGLQALSSRAEQAAVVAATIAERRAEGTEGRRWSASRPVAVLAGLRRVTVLDTEFDPVTLGEAVVRISDWIGRTGPQEDVRRPAHIVTANPEIVMRARKDVAVRGMLERADLVVADGIGVVGAARLLGTPVPERVPGVELMEALLLAAAGAGWGVYLLGGEPGVAERAAENIRKNLPKIRIVGVRDGYFGKEEAAVAEAVAAAGPDIVFVGMGAPRQELFIAAQRDGVWRNIPVAIGVGGSIDVLAGRVQRAPAGWQRLGLEWLYRIVREPSRLQRAFALPKFAVLVLWRVVRRNLLYLGRIHR